MGFWLCAGAAVLAGACITASATSTESSNTAVLFPSKGYEDRIAFWEQIFTTYGERDVVFHDKEDLRLVYEVVSFEQAAGSDVSEALRQMRELGQKETELRQLISSLGEEQDRDRLTPRQKELLDQLASLGYSLSRETTTRLASNIRQQRGIKERFKSGVVRSGRYLHAMEEIFRSEGLPPELALLPHVESSFNYQSRSSKGAAGIWQFMPSTGRQFLRIDTYVDERLDPLRATEAAARFLKENYERLGNWPLAITAYNHGPNGIARAREDIGHDLLDIIAEYEAPSFGFASKNFYAEFLAAVAIARKPELFLDPIEIEEPLEFESIFPTRAYDPRQLTTILGLNETVLSEYNPQVAPAVWRTGRTLPAGTMLRVPLGMGDEASRLLDGNQTFIARGETRKSETTLYRVQAGDTLTAIAQKFGMGVKELQQANKMASPGQLQRGQMLQVRKISAAQSRPY
jgi:membrane-bound lytic murein transglycosylase D